MEIVKSLVLFIFLCIAAYTDYKEGKIKNNLTLPLVIVGMCLSFLDSGVNGLFTSCQGIVFTFLILLVLFVLRAFGAGDIKLLCGIASVKGFGYTMDNFAIAMLISLIFFTFSTGINLTAFKKVKKIFLKMKYMIIFKTVEIEKEEDSKKIAFGISIFLAYLIQFIFKINIF